MDSVVAASIVAALGAGILMGMLLVPTEISRVRRMGALGGLRDMAGRAMIVPAKRGPLRRARAWLAECLSERDEVLVAGAGFTNAAAELYRQWRPILPVAAALISVVLRMGRADLALCLVGAVAAAILLPEMILQLLGNRRRARIVRELPELVDLLGVAAAGGSSLAGALRAAAAEAQGPIFEEVRSAVRETAAGTPLQSALHHLAKRIGLPVVSAFVGSLCESESLGVPLADSLAIQAETARAAYRQQVEGRLNQLPLQMTICALVFLFPTAFVVVALPNIIAFTRGLW